MKVRSILVALSTIAILALAGCNNDDIASQLGSAKKQGVAEGVASESAKADQKLNAAKDEMSKLAKQVVREGDYRMVKNCDITPASLATSDAKQNFPQNAQVMYQSACKAEVFAMKAERDKQIAQAKAAEQKRLAKAEQDRKHALAKAKKRAG